MTAHLNINEVFGPTIQGEGRNAGQLCSFVRTANCNLSCSWCDTPYTWDWTRFDRATEVRRMVVEDVAEQVAALEGRIIISGGEPLLQSAALTRLMEYAPDRAYDIETNGTRPLRGTYDLLANITCSPKVIPSAGQGSNMTVVDEEVLTHPRADFKFVVADQRDLDAVLRWRDEHASLVNLDGRVWVMPEGTDHATLTGRSPWLMEAASNHLLNFTSRLHVYGWADTRGH